MKPKNFETNNGVTELAHKAGVSITTVSRKLRQGKTPEQILKEAADWKEKNKHKAVNKDDTVDESQWEAQRRKTIAEASLKELELAQKRGELVSLIEVNAWVSGCIVHARDILTRIPDELADRLSKEADPVVIRTILNQEIRRALQEVSTYKPVSR